MITLEPDSRYARQQLITWWDQERLTDANVLVVGAGALGNEIVKNLALLGVGSITVIDMDHIEISNLARCALFRDSDAGRAKAEALAASAMELNPNIRATGRVASVMALGLGAFVPYDIVLAGLDNREARLHVGRVCRKLGKFWVDGAIEGLRGLVRVFAPEGACYECSLGEVDRRIMAARKSCALLSRQEMLAGKVPTNSTTASLVAAMQVQEAVKILVGREDLLALRNEAFMYTGDTMDSYKIAYTQDEWCASHDLYEVLQAWPTDCHPDLRSLVAWVTAIDFCPDAIDLESELITARRCQECGWVDHTVRALAALLPGEGSCPTCTHGLTMDAACSIKPDDPVARFDIAAFSLPANDVVTLRSGERRCHFVIPGTTDA